MVYFQTKNPDSSNFWRALEWKMMVYSIFIWNIHITAIWYILWPFGNLEAIWDILHRFGILCQEKSGNPGYISEMTGGLQIIRCSAFGNLSRIISLG
jgi:hypothetical protein